MQILAASPDAIADAARRLRAGRLVGLPTETVYGLAGDARDARAVAEIYRAKGRPQFNPLITHVPDVAAVARHAHLDGAGLALARALWPGPLTLVLTRLPASDVCDLACAGLPTIALRVPSHPVAQAVLRLADIPVAAPSANRSGHVSPTTAAHVAGDFAEEDLLVLDGGATPVGLESTVVDVTTATPVVLRLGGVSREHLRAILGHDVAVATGEPGAPASPGMLARHYAPRAPLRLAAAGPRPGEAWLGFGPAMPDMPNATPTLNLSPAGDTTEAAARLYASLRQLDAKGVAGIAVARIPDTGLGEAINDRLRRAALGRETVDDTARSTP